MYMYLVKIQINTLKKQYFNKIRLKSEFGQNE